MDKKKKQVSYIFSLDSMVSIEAPIGTDEKSLQEKAIEKFKYILHNNHADLICEEIDESEVG